jgi:hypothetical protein
MIASLLHRRFSLAGRSVAANPGTLSSELTGST